MQLLDFSQQLCDRLEQLVVTYASYGLLCLDETEPNRYTDRHIFLLMHVYYSFIYVYTYFSVGLEQSVT